MIDTSRAFQCFKNHLGVFYYELWLSTVWTNFSLVGTLAANLNDNNSYRKIHLSGWGFMLKFGWMIEDILKLTKKNESLNLEPYELRCELLKENQKLVLDISLVNHSAIEHQLNSDWTCKKLVVGKSKLEIWMTKQLVFIPKKFLAINRALGESFDTHWRMKNLLTLLD